MLFSFRWFLWIFFIWKFRNAQVYKGALKKRQKSIASVFTQKMNTTIEILFFTLFSILWLTSVAGHLILLKLLLTANRLKLLRLPPGPSWSLLLSTTVADLLALLFGLPFTSAYIILTEDWHFGLPLCKLSHSVETFSLTMTVLVIAKLMMMCYNMTVKSHRPKPTTAEQTLLLVSIWALALATAILPFVFYTVKKEHRYIDHHKFPFLEELSVLKINKWLQQITVERNICVLSENGLGPLSFFLEIVCVILQIFVPLPLLVYLFIKVANCKNKKRQPQLRFNRQNTV